MAEKALPYCNIVCITGSEMKEKLSGYLQVLSDAEPLPWAVRSPARISITAHKRPYRQF